jgi:hypothetical protein
VQRAELVVALLAAVAAGSALTAWWLVSRSTASSPIPTATTTYTAPPPVELPLFRDGQRCGVGVQPGSSYSCTDDELLCPRAVAWSPDERQVAILSHCGGFHGASSAILVYDTAASHLRATIALDAIVAHAPQVPTTCDGESQPNKLDTRALFRLPSGRLAVVGSVTIWSGLAAAPRCPPWDSLVLVDADGTHPQVALAPARTQANGLIPCGRTWDLQSARLAAAWGGRLLPPALGYRWAEGGGLQPLTSTTSPPAPGPGPVGTPAGGTQFTIWQSTIVGRSHLSVTPNVTPAARGRGDLHDLTALLDAFSPDGRYAYAGGVSLFRLEPAGQQPPSPSALQQARLADAPLLPVKDAALRRVVGELPPPVLSSNGTEFDNLITALAWRPDGAVVAALGPDLGGAGQGTEAQQTVWVVDCAAGACACA